MTAPHASGGADRDRADRLVLPLSGWSARLRRDGGPPFRLVVDPGGGAPFTHTLLPQAARGQLVLGAHRVRRLHPPGDAITVAYGVLPAKPMRVAFLRRRPWRTAHVQPVDPLVLADRVWLAEHPGRFDEVQVDVAGRTATRLL